jgi:NAD-dependent SIR2 family protein deacetylase
MYETARPSVSQLRERAEHLATSGKLDDAIALYRQIVAFKPEAPEHQNRLADLLERLGNIREAVATWRDAARLYEKDGLTPRAVGIWRKVIRQSPDDPEPRVHLAALHRKQGHVMEAAEADADAAAIWARCGEIEAAFQLLEPMVDDLLAARQPQAAAERLEQILANDRSHPRALLKLAAAYRQLGRHTDLARVYSDLAQTNVNPQAGHRELARAALDVVARFGVGEERVRPQAPRPGEVDDHITRAARELKSATAIVIAAGTAANVPHVPDYRDARTFTELFPEYASQNLTYEMLSHARRFEDAPHLAWGFYAQRVATPYPEQPLPVMQRLRTLSTRPRKGTFVLTSSADSLFEVCGWDPARIVECYGRLDHLQCSASCGIAPWEFAELGLTIDRKGRARDPLPRCPNCRATARPNVLMFGDWGWDSVLLDEQEARFRRWLDEVTADPDARLVILECAESTDVPMLRLMSERLRYERKARLIRISTEDWTVPVGEIGLPLTVEEALRRIESL